MNDLPWWTAIPILFFLGTPLVASAVGLRAGRRSALAGQVSTAWVSAALLLTRAALLYIVVGGLLVALLVDRDSTGLGDVTRQGSVMTVPVESYEPTSLCPLRTVRNLDGFAPLQLECAASRAVAKADPPNAQLRSFGFELTFDSSPSERREFTALSVGGLLALLAGLVALERILARTARRAPFAVSNVRWLRLLAAALAVGGWLVPELTLRFTQRLSEEHGAMGEAGVDYLPVGGVQMASLIPLLAAVLIFALAEVWRHGIRLQRDVEATV